MDEKEILDKLQAMHLEHSDVPSVLCSASPHDFDRSHPDIAEYSNLQAGLYGICRQRGDRWTDI
jgi:hypothetical protein